MTKITNKEKRTTNSNQWWEQILTYLKLLSVKYWMLLSTSLSESSCSPWNVSSSIHCRLFRDISTYFMEFCSISKMFEKFSEKREQNETKNMFNFIKCHWKQILLIEFKCLMENVIDNVNRIMTYKHCL